MKPKKKLHNQVKNQNTNQMKKTNGIATKLESFSTEELKGYRNTLVSSLEKQCNLLEEIKNSDFIINRDEAKTLTKGKIDEFLHILNGEIKKLENFDVVLDHRLGLHYGW